MSEVDPATMAAISRAPMPMSRGEIFELQGTAKSLFERLQRHISRAEKEADPEEQLAVYYHTPAGAQVRVEEIGWHNPSLIILYGKNAASQHRTRVLVHQESLALVLQFERLPKRRTSSKPVGFLWDESEDRDDGT